MIEYKSYRFVNGKARWIIVDEDGKIVNRDPSKDELKGLEKEIIRYNKTNTCDKCREQDIIEKLVPSTNACKEKNKNGSWTGRWICIKCYLSDYNLKIDYIKSSRRSNNLDQNSTNAKGDLFQELTCIWRSTVSTVQVEDLNKKLNNYHCPIDHSIDSELGIIDTKGSMYNIRSTYEWGFDIHREHKKEKGIDNIICYCISKDGKCVERIYIFPRKEFYRNKIGIYENSVRSTWYDKYEIKDEDIIKKVNDIWKEIIRRK